MAAVDCEINPPLQKSETAAEEKNGAVAVATNPEIRRRKAEFLEELPKLQRLAVKKVKGSSREEWEARSDLARALKDRIEEIPDGSKAAAKQGSDVGPSGVRAGINFNSAYDGRFDNEYFQQTEVSEGFRQEYEMRRMRQDEGLDVIAEGLDTLKNMAHDLNEELSRKVPIMDEIDDKVDRPNSDLKNANLRLKDTVRTDEAINDMGRMKNIYLNGELNRQVPLMDEIDDKVDRPNSDLKNTNVKLEDTVKKLRLFQLRSSRKFCFDIFLLCIILGIAAYLYNVLK